MNAVVRRSSALASSLLLLAVGSVAGCASGGDLGRDAASPRRDGSVPIDAPTRACTEDADCDDGNPCNGTETCASSTCAPGTAIDCSDSVACTTDACDPGTGTCAHTPDDSTCSPGLVCDPVDDCSAPRPCEVDADCDDAIFCNGTETCDPAFGCRRGDAPTCDDGLACTNDACDATTDACAHTDDDTVCDDGLPCNGAEACEPGDPTADGDGCVIGTTPTCDDGVACTVDVCVDAMGGCVASPDDATCSNGTFCDGEERCDVTAGCTAGTPPSCDDGIGCTAGACDATIDACVQTGNDDACQDGATCNGRERCDATGSTPGMGCVPGAPMDCSDGAACTTDSCVEPGTCRHGGSDADGDGYTAVGCATGNDCDDLVPGVHPGATEICDGVDNDCSGGVDNGSGMECALGSAPRACTTSCGSPGLQACNGSCRLGPCIGTAELCNDCDDDSDGIVDDGLTCRRGTSSACTTSCGTSGTRTCASDCSGYGACRAAGESCNDCDDDGDGLVDDGLPCRRGTSSACTTTCGTAGSRVCAVDCSGYGSCRAPAEICNACDDDGNGTADDGFACRQGQTQSCTTTCGTTGVRTCASNCSGYGACVATEICNGCDDDGDGTTDEGFMCAAGATQACTTACGGAGMRTCNASCGGFGACTAIESCNGCDDDGDGTADEDFACRQGASSACTTSCGTSGTRTCSSTCSGLGACTATEACNGCDDDADGTADDGFACVSGSTQACTTTCGTTGSRACNGTCSGYGTCGATEVCNGCDDDADGTPDDGFTCRQGATQACTTACGTSGSQTCNGTCSAFGACGGTEVCNGCDDDADGTPDDGFTCRQGATQACTNACGVAGTQTCNGACSAFSACIATTEVCANGCDDDGDGAVDEGCTPTGPANDLCTGAIALSGNGTRMDTLVGATAQTTDCGSGTDVFYAVTVTQPTIVYLSTLGGASFDTRISYRGTSCAGTSSQCVDDSCGTLQTHLAQVVGAGTHYFAVHTFTSSTTPGTFTLTWKTVATTSGDNTLVTLPAAGTTQTFTGSTTGTSVMHPGTCGASTTAGSGAEDVYYWLQCPSDTRSYSANTCNAASTYDTTLWMSLNGTVLACNDDDSTCSSPSTLRSRLTSVGATGAGVVQLVMDGYSTTGSYSVAVTF